MPSEVRAQPIVTTPQLPVQLPVQPIAPSPVKQIAIVIDDIGYRSTDREALTLPGPVTYAILPYTPYAKRLAKQAFAQDKEVMAHIPMEAMTNNHLLGQGALTGDMDEQRIKEELRQALASIPHVRGMNNHMGSRLTQMRQPMEWTMEILREQQLYFLDSKTVPGSTAEEVAQAMGVKSNHRQIFLDNQLTPAYLQQQFDHLLRIADKYHQGIAIAHPHPETIAFLQQQLPKLAQRGITLVPLSALMTTPNTIGSGTPQITLLE